MKRKRERDIFYLACAGRRVRRKFEHSADQHGHLILYTTIPILDYFKGQYSLLLQYEILEKLVTFIYSKQQRPGVCFAYLLPVWL